MSIQLEYSSNLTRVCLDDLHVIETPDTAFKDKFRFSMTFVPSRQIVYPPGAGCPSTILKNRFRITIETPFNRLQEAPQYIFLVGAVIG